jgi:hypothetical protein
MATRKLDNHRKMSTVPWREDPGILYRLELVAALYHQPLGQIWRTINARLVAGNQERQIPPQDPVSYETVKLDRERVRELASERILGNVQEHLTTLQLARESVQRDILSTPAGPARATLYAVLVRITEDMARLDGTWSGGGATPPGGDEFLDSPSPQDLLAAGKINREQYRASLYVIAVRTGAKLPAAAQVIEGKARTVKKNGSKPPARGAIIPGYPKIQPNGEEDDTGSHRFEAEDLNP